MEAWLRCTLHPGQFSSELAAVVRSFNGKLFSLFVPKFDLNYQDNPTEDNPVDGWIKVEIIKEDTNGLFLVMLPQSTLENGQYLTVTADQQRRVAAKHEVTHDPFQH